jgi:hypothetical protein
MANVISSPASLKTASTIKLHRGQGAQSQRLSLDGTWRFDVEGETDQRTITIPLPWEAAYPELRDRPCTATYQRTVRIPAGWTDSVIRLHVGAADYYAEVSVNGYLVGTHEGGYTPFDLEVQEFLAAGQDNLISIKVSDGAPARMVSGSGDLTPERRAIAGVRPFPFTEIPHGKQSWYGTVGGIWQSVYVERRAEMYIENVFVRPDVENGGASVRVRLAHPPLDPTGYTLRLTVDSPHGAAPVPPLVVPLPGARAETVNLVLIVPEPALWQLESPRLYRLTAELRRDGKPVDTYTARFGMRTIEARDGNILLNDTPIFIAGALDQDFYPGTIYTPPSTAFLRDQFVKAKEMGLNTLRCHIKTPDPRYLDLCDEMGILVWYEVPNWAVLTKKSGERGRQHLEAMLERDYNHPSIGIISVVNESWGVNLRHRREREWLVEMFDYAKALDPTRLFVDNSACNGNYHVKSDLDDYHIYFSIPDHADRWARWCADFASRPRWTYSPHGDAQRSFREPLLLSEFGNWGLPKLSLLKKGYDGEEPWWFRTGAEPARPEGVAERFLRYRLDRAFGVYDRLAEASQDAQWTSLKYEIEQMRRHSAIVGYVITEFTDLHWESNGLLDMCRNPKTFHKRLARIQGQDLIIPAHEKSAYWSGDRFTLRILLSHFGGRDLADGTLHWTVEGMPALSGQMLLPEHGVSFGATPLGEITFRVPEVRKALDVTLRLQLFDRSNKLVSENDEKFTFFPSAGRRISGVGPIHIHDPHRLITGAAAILRDAGVALTDRLEPGSVCLTSEVDEALLQFLDGGGVALVLALDRLSLPRTTSRLASVGRDRNGWWGDWCSGMTWFAPAGPWSALPQTRQFDFTFREVIPRRVLMGWDAERDADDVLAGLFVGWIGFPAAYAAGFRYGSGKALCTTFELLRSRNDPVAVTLLGEMLRFVASRRFAPTKAFSREQVALPHVLVPPADDGGAEWRYTTTDPGGEWMQPDYDDSAWRTGRSGFGRGRTGAPVNTRWSSDDIWLRRSVVVPPDGLDRAHLRFWHNDDMDVFVNGEPLLARSGSMDEYEDIALTPPQIALFHPGRNVISVHSANRSGAQFVDLGLTIAPGALDGRGGTPARPPQNGAAPAQGSADMSSMSMAEEHEAPLETTRHDAPTDSEGEARAAVAPGT